MELPQELIDDILAFLADDHAALRACALVSHAFLAPARRLLFATIRLKATSPSNGVSVPQERCARLLKLLQTTPSLIPCIRHLDICEGSPLHHYNSRVQGSTTWVTTERSLAALFRTLTHVTKLEFSATSTLYWTLLPPTFQSALCTLLAKPGLRYLRLHSWMFPSARELQMLLAHCRDLRAFALSSTNVGAGTGDAPVFNPALIPGPEPTLNLCPHAGETEEGQGPRLEVLTLDYVTFAQVEHWLHGQGNGGWGVDLRDVRELRVAHCSDADADIVVKLLRTVGPSLEHLHFKPGSWPGESYFYSHFHSLCLFSSFEQWRGRTELMNARPQSPPLTFRTTQTVLSSLAFAFSTRSSTTTSAISVPASSYVSTSDIVQDLSSEILAPSLTALGLEFFIDPKRLAPRWAELDDLLTAGEPAFARLERIEFGLFTSVYGGSSVHGGIGGTVGSVGGSVNSSSPAHTGSSVTNSSSSSTADFPTPPSTSTIAATTTSDQPDAPHSTCPTTPQRSPHSTASSPRARQDSPRAKTDNLDVLTLKHALSGLAESGVGLRCYQLGVKRQGSSRYLGPRINTYEG